MERVIAGANRVLVCMGIFGVAWLGPYAAPARAAAFTVTLRYAAGAGCPDATNFKAVVSARLGYDPFSESAADHVLVHIKPRRASLGGRIEWRDSGGHWAGDQNFPLGNTNCLQLVRAMGFALALQIQFLAKTGAPPVADVAPPTERAPPAEKGPPPEAATPAPSPPVAPPVVITPPSRPPPLPPGASGSPEPTRGPGPAFALGAGTSVGLGMASSQILLGRVFGGLSWERVSVELAVQVSLPSITRRPDGAGFSQQYLLLSAASCAALSRWNACLLVNAGEVRLDGQDIERPSSAVVPLVQAGARLAVVQRLGPRVFLDVHADGLAVLTRWIGRLDQVPVWTAPRFAATIGIDAGVRFR